MRTFFYHGGAPGLRVGQYILPPAKTGAASTASFGAAGVCDRNKVYVTISSRAALMVACHARGGRCKPVGLCDHASTFSAGGPGQMKEESDVVPRPNTNSKWRFEMTELEKTILACAQALAAASRDEVEDATRAAEGECGSGDKAIGVILNGIRHAKRAQDWTSRGGTIAHITWPNGATATLEVEGAVSLRDMLRSLDGGEND